MKYKKVIIWGHPLYSHTHSYVHDSYYKAFKYLGYDTYWFHDGDYPTDFDYSNSLFIGEGFADGKIPLNDTSCYCIMYCPSPIKYANVGRYIDIRMAAVDFKDHIQEYSLDKKNTQKVGKSCYYVPKTTNQININNDYHNYMMNDFDKLYISWATNLLPQEINFDDAYIKRENVIYFCGSISNSGRCENYSAFVPFIKACHDNNIQWIHNDPWSNPLSNEDMIKLIQKSLLGIDIRGAEHVRQKLLTCRVIKNISYGHLGLTNSEEILNELDGHCIYNSNAEQLFYDGIANKDRHNIIIDAMKYVKENHTYINRIESLLSVL